MTWSSVDEIRAATRARKQREPERGDYFGEAETSFFGSRVEPTVYGGRYFVESVQPPHGPRVWHVVRATDEPDFDTIGPWGSDGYEDAEQAHTTAAVLAVTEAAGRLVARADRSERFAPCATCRAVGKERPSWATFVYSAPGENEPFDVCTEHVPEVVFDYEVEA